MEKLSMCRICLSNDIPMRSIVRTPLQEVYESLTTMPFVAEDIRPVVVCNLCCARLENSSKDFLLKEKCLRSEKLFAELLQSNVQVNLQVMPDAHLSTEGVIQMTPNVFGYDVKQENAEDNAAVERASNLEWDVPLSTVKEEPDDIDTDDAAGEQDDTDPYHSTQGLHMECDIPMDIVKKEPDDVKTYDVAVEQDDADPYHNAQGLHMECDIPMDIVKKEPDKVKTYDVAVEQDDTDPYHSALGLHTECDIPLDIVKEEPDDVDSGNNTHCEHGRRAPGLAGEETLLAFIVVKPTPSASLTSLSSDDELRREREEKKRERNREYQRAWRKRQKDLKKKGEKRKKRRKGLKENDKNVEELFQKKLDDLQIERKEKKKERNRENQRAWRQRHKDLKKKGEKRKRHRKGLKENDKNVEELFQKKLDDLQIERKQKKKERNRENQRAWRQRQKDLKKKGESLNDNDKNVEQLFQKKLDYLQMKKKKLDSNEDQEKVVQCRATQNLENVQLEQNQFLTQQFRIYGERHECVTPKAILHRTIDIPDDGNCLFHSLIRVLQLQISTCDLRRQLRASAYLNSCHNPQEAYNILSSNNEYGDLDCVYLFAKIYNQNICVHNHYFNGISTYEDSRFCHFKANDTHNWFHLDLHKLHFTPYLSDDEKKKEDERKQKQKNREYSKRYRDKKRLLNLRTGPSARDVLDVQPVIHTSQIAGPSTGGVPYVPQVFCSSQIAELLSRDVPSSLSIHSNYNSIEE